VAILSKFKKIRLNSDFSRFDFTFLWCFSPFLWRHSTFAEIDSFKNFLEN
jgi:hypothetical protein